MIMKKQFLTAAAAVLLLGAGCSSKAVPPYYAVDHFYFEEEGEAFKEAFEKTTVDMYRWYQSIEGEDGVYLLNSSYYDDELLHQWKSSQIYDSVPEKGFWYFAVSENYLRDRGFELSSEDIEYIRSGRRLYLLPASMPEEERSVMEKYLEEQSLYGLNGHPLIPTAFESAPAFTFMTYHSDVTLETENDGEIQDPVIFVCSCENMKYFESESLIATGRTDSYIKLTEEAYQKYVKNGYPEELKERKITFLPLHRISN